jgi:hypothetical protein
MYTKCAEHLDGKAILLILKECQNDDETAIFFKSVNYKMLTSACLSSR